MIERRNKGLKQELLVKVFAERNRAGPFRHRRNARYIEWRRDSLAKRLFRLLEAQPINRLSGGGGSRYRYCGTHQHVGRRRLSEFRQRLCPFQSGLSFQFGPSELLVNSAHIDNVIAQGLSQDRTWCRRPFPFVCNRHFLHPRSRRSHDQQARNVSQSNLRFLLTSFSISRKMSAF